MLRPAVAGVLFAAVCAPALLRAQAEPAAREYQIKAVFLFNFVQFVEWPPAAFTSASAPIRIGVLGDNPFHSALDEAVRGETVRERKVTVHYSRRLEELEGCHVLFVCASEKDRVGEILAGVDARAVLTVGETPDFARRGGVVNFYSDGNKVRFEINPQVGQRHGLRLSSQLLSLARIVGNPPEGK